MFKFNPITGTLDLVGSSSPSGGDSTSIDVFVLDSTDISNKYIVLSSAPTTKNKTMCFIPSAPFQNYSVDYVVTSDDSDKRLSWDSLGLDGVLEIGDKLYIVYL